LIGSALGNIDRMCQRQHDLRLPALPVVDTIGLEQADR
jgi:hypothetical protein